MPTMIQPGTIFKDNLQQLPSIDRMQRIDLIGGKGAVVASIENQPGKQGSLAVYQYLECDDIDLTRMGIPARFEL